MVGYVWCFRNQPDQGLIVMSICMQSCPGCLQGYSEQNHAIVYVPMLMSPGYIDLSGLLGP